MKRSQSSLTGILLCYRVLNLEIRNEDELRGGTLSLITTNTTVVQALPSSSLS